MEQQYLGLQENYGQLQASHARLLRLVEALQSQDDERASTIYRLLRRGVSPDSIDRQVGTGDALMELRLSTETRFRFEFPLRRQMPSEILRLNSPYLQSLLYETLEKPETEEASPSTTHITGRYRYKPQYFKPYQSAKMIEPRLNSVMPSKWTNVSDDDELMRSLLYSFFQYEYAWYSFFHIDCFLDDLISGADEHCSSLLVNVILTLACVSLFHGCYSFSA